MNITLHNTTLKHRITTTDELNNVLNSRTLREITNKLDPYKKNPKDSPLATLTNKLEC